jgi:pilus assembly protein Flp/PilA
MNRIILKMYAFIQAREGATAIEYGLIAGGISLAIVAAVFSFGSDLKSVFNSLGSSMQSVATQTSG